MSSRLSAQYRLLLCIKIRHILLLGKVAEEEEKRKKSGLLPNRCACVSKMANKNTDFFLAKKFPDTSLGTENNTQDSLDRLGCITPKYPSSEQCTFTIYLHKDTEWKCATIILDDTSLKK